MPPSLPVKIATSFEEWARTQLGFGTAGNAPDYRIGAVRTALAAWRAALASQASLAKRGTEPSLDAGAKKRIAANVYAHCAQIPGANSYTAAEFAITETLKALAGSAPSEKPVDYLALAARHLPGAKSWAEGASPMSVQAAPSEKLSDASAWHKSIRATVVNYDPTESQAETVPHVPAGGELPNLPVPFKVENPPNSEPYGLFTARQMIAYRRASMQAEAPAAPSEKLAGAGFGVTGVIAAIRMAGFQLVRTENGYALASQAETVSHVPAGKESALDRDILKVALTSFSKDPRRNIKARERAAALASMQAEAPQATKDAEDAEDADLANAFRDVAARNYKGVYAFLFIEHVLEKEQEYRAVRQSQGEAP